MDIPLIIWVTEEVIARVVQRVKTVTSVEWVLCPALTIAADKTEPSGISLGLMDQTEWQRWRVDNTEPFTDS